MRLTRHATTLVAALLVSAAAPDLYAQATRVAVVDLQRAIGETEDGRRAQDRLKRLMKRRQRELDAAQEELKALKSAFDEAPQAEQQRLAGPLQEAYVGLQTKYVEYQRELAEGESEATRDIVARMETILRRIGQDEGYTLILERTHSGVVWVPTHLDLTDRVIQAYAAERPARPAGGGATKRRGGATKAPAQAPAEE